MAGLLVSGGDSGSTSTSTSTSTTTDADSVGGISQYLPDEDSTDLLATYDEAAGVLDEAAGELDEAFSSGGLDAFAQELILGTHEAGELGWVDEALGGLDESVARQFDATPGGGFADESIRYVTEAAGDAVDVAVNLGPDWLDEAALVALVLVALFVLRPYAQLGAEAAGAA